ncbi:MAG TPA: methylated-DNA--[protein]-cysteine S-methyltransferase [Rhodanobacteraceae bacterium]|jgi:AraC family transcriptional regulator of adaptative response/methylated-DNA-[protein]-cysteine methyltransferase|nr:methylated-DNA--[protein]-cysteine S-methyltransferase [Rhodanobacteraceae bacterium]
MHARSLQTKSSDPLEQARLLLERGDETPTLAALAAAVGLSPAWLQRSFRRRFGVSPAEYARARRFGAFKRALRDGHGVTDAVYAAGFGSGSRVYERSDSLLGMPPARYRDGGAAMSIRYTTTASPLGRVLVAATERGLCAVNLGNTDAQLLAALHEEFPRADVTRVDAGRDEWLAAVIARIARQFTGESDTRTPAALPPLDITATAFQWRVWQALTRIPAGETRSYGEIAREIGEPGAARAVGRACGANQLALIVPCHRVVRADGSPGGWRWGAVRKRQLLAKEKRAAKPPASS